MDKKNPIQIHTGTNNKSFFYRNYLKIQMICKHYFFMVFLQSGLELLESKFDGKSYIITTDGTQVEAEFPLLFHQWV